jgi:hypothetical protein
MEKFDSLKRRLPAVVFSGVFNHKRSVENIEIYNPILVLDIDKIPYSEYSTYFEKIKSDPFIFACWRSPSGNGIKALLHLQYSNPFNLAMANIFHRGAFAIVEEYFWSKYEIQIDKSGNDITRLCFFSSDSDIVVKSKYKQFEIKLDLEALSMKLPKDVRFTSVISVNEGRVLYDPEGRNNYMHRLEMRRVLLFLEKKKASITSTYDDWFKVAMALANSFTYDVGLKYFIRLSKMDKAMFDEANCTSFLKNCYIRRNGTIGINSLIYLAQQVGYSNGKKVGSS